MKQHIGILIVLLISIITFGETKTEDSINYKYLLEASDSVNKNDLLLKIIGYNKKESKVEDSLNTSELVELSKNKMSSNYITVYKNIQKNRNDLYKYWTTYIISEIALSVLMGAFMVVVLFLSSTL